MQSSLIPKLKQAFTIAGFIILAIPIGLLIVDLARIEQLSGV